MINSKATCIIIVLVTIVTGCERVVFFPDDPIVDVTTRVLAHRGGGSAFEGNNLEACAYGLSRVDGIEVDIQRSEDNDLWLSHSSEVALCGSLGGTCFASLQSSEIIAIDACLGPTVNFTTLDSLFKYIHDHHPGSFISLDVKAWTPCEVNDLNVTRKMNELAAKIISLTEFYGLQNQVMVESETGDFLYYVKRNCNFIETYLTSFGDFERAAAGALDAGFDGISYKFKFGEEIIKDQVDLLHRKGLKIQVWTVVGEADFNEAKSLNVDFIQTDDI